MRRLAALVIGVALAGSACGGSSPGTSRTITGPLMIASLNPYSGPDAGFGPEEYAGCYVAIGLINQIGGVLGHQLECSNVDTQGTPAGGRSHSGSCSPRPRTWWPSSVPVLMNPCPPSP
jgi:hypothetical protein